MSLCALLFDAASRHASHFALHIADERKTYADLTRSALHIAARLRALGAEREAVGIVGQRKLGSYAGVLGIVYAACHYVPLKAKAPPDKTIALLRAANIRFWWATRTTCASCKRNCKARGKVTASWPISRRTANAQAAKATIGSVSMPSP